MQSFASVSSEDLDGSQSGSHNIENYFESALKRKIGPQRCWPLFWLITSQSRILPTWAYICTYVDLVLSHWYCCLELE